VRRLKKEKLIVELCKSMRRSWKKKDWKKRKKGEKKNKVSVVKDSRKGQ
jgi:hypothetical protein